MLVAVKHILKWMTDYIFMGSGGDLNLLGYIYSDFQANKESRKSTSRSVFTLGNRAIVWRSIEKSSITNFIIEVEYITTSEITKEAV